VVGASWEGFALEQLIRIQNLSQVYFWATHTGAELDLFVLVGGKRLGFEFNFAESPRITRSMRVALADLRLDHLYIIHPGKEQVPLDDCISAVGLRQIPDLFD